MLNIFICYLRIMKENIIQEKTFNFALKIIQLHRELISSNEYVLSKQLLKS